MGWVKIRVPRTSQPQDACGIDWSNPLTNGLRRAVNASHLYESAGSTEVKRIGNTFASRERIYVGDFGAFALEQTPLQKYTLFAVVIVPPPSATFAIITNHSNNNETHNYGLFHENGFPRVGFKSTTGAYNYSSSSIAPPVGSISAYCASYDRNLQKVYTNGELGSSIAQTQTASVNGSEVTQIGAAWGVGRTYSYTTDGIYLVLIFDRALSDAEVKSLSANPWQIFEPEELLIWVPDAAGAGAGGGTDTLTAQSIVTGAPTAAQASLGQTHALTSQAVSTTAPSVTQGTLGQTHALTSKSISTAAPTLTTPALTSSSTVDNLIAQAISAGQITVTQATLAQHHALSAQGIDTAAPGISTPTLTAAANFDNLAAQSITTGAPTLTSPAIGQVHALAGGAVAAGAPTFSTPTVGQMHVLLSQGIASGAPVVGLATAGELGPAPFDAAQMAYILAYIQEHLVVPTPSEIAAAVRIDLAAELLQLTKVSKLHGVGVDLVVTPTSRTAGSVSQTISTSGDAVTVSAA